ncbi:SUMF1/EgtB/PvdO family nonheme iron enzyme, partial [Opitutales bacterium]|nr:SUMF1/EgtB/PvdO family nonheme iron enzyme [Opitutales bacterium]
MKTSIFISLLSLCLFSLSTAAPPVPFSGKLAVDGKNFHGNARFSFSIVDGQGDEHWRHSQEQGSMIDNVVLNGRYLVLLGGQGMKALPPRLFLDYDQLFLRVQVDLQDGQGIRLLEPDQRITSSPYALTAELARLAEKASVADAVSPGSITQDMLADGVFADLNRTIELSDLPAEVLQGLSRTITLNDLGLDVVAELNSTIDHSRLSLEVREDLNRTIVITREMLPQNVRDDLNRTIGVAQLSAEVNEKLNRDFTIQPGSISKSLLGQDVLSDLNRTIQRHHLSEDLRAELNRTIRLTDLSPEVIADLNDSIAPGSITIDMLASGVRADLNRTITLSDLAPEVIADLNDSIQQGSITTHQLSEQILKYLKPEITLAPQAPGLIFNGQTITLHSRAEGKYLTYQWYKNGQALAGANNKRYVIEDVNGTMHDGNYTLVVSNDFGSITTQPTELLVDGTPTSHSVASISMDMIFCPPGTFTMGSPTNETGRGTDETQHLVTLSHGFYLGKYEVTQAQYQAVMNGNSAGLSADPSQFKGSNRPVEKASWEDAQIFLSQLNTIEQTAGRLPAGWKYVLPTEAQWEYACRAGSTTAYSWGNDINSSRANYNWDGGSNDGNDYKQTRDVGQYAANPWGFFDMQGNVWEWVSDWKANYFTGAQTNPEGPASGSSRVLRGGSWRDEGASLRSAKRHNYTPSSRTGNIGFRVGFQPVQPDTANPELELFGGASVTREAGQAWADPGAAGHDARDGNLTASITVTGTVDMNTTGTYVLTYSVADAAGNTATTNRTVTVVGNRSVDLNATVA